MSRHIVSLRLDPSMTCKAQAVRAALLARLGVDSAIDGIGRLLHARLHILQVCQVLRDKLARRVVRVVAVRLRAQPCSLSQPAVHEICKDRQVDSKWRITVSAGGQCGPLSKCEVHMHKGVWCSPYGCLRSKRI